MKNKPLILIADDSPSIRAKLKDSFTENGFDVIDAIDGIDCIKKVFKYFPSFVILDVKMPNITGYQACRFIKNHPKTSAIPVMLLTALDKPIDELWGYETGADIYRSKSTRIDILIEDVKKFVKERHINFPKEELEITEVDILSFLNEILDNRLFELTLINDITELSFRTNNITELVTACSQYLYKIANFYCIGFALEYEGRFKVYLYSNYEYGKTFDDMISYARQTFLDKGITSVEFVYNVGTEILPLSYPDKQEMFFIENVATSENLQHLSGGVFISLKREDVNQIKKINFLLNTVLLVLRNGMLYQRVLDLSMIDELTTLFNRRKIMDILRTEIERSERYGYELSLIIADIDDFKQINDNFGHKKGDEVLKRVSTILKTSVRKVDYVGRFGGEEFLIVSPQTTLENAVKLSERIRNIVESMKIEGLNKSLTLSFGVSHFRQSLDIDRLVNEADEALYMAKKSGKNCVKWKN